jgi:hypothetical protein
MGTSVKRLGREADQLSPYIAEVKNGGTTPLFPDMLS